MEDIIKKAIEGGYSGHGFDKRNYTIFSDGICHNGYIKNEQLVLDPLFWQALSKACGWEQWGTVENPAIVTYDITFADFLMKPEEIESGKTGVEQAIKHNREKNISGLKIKGILNFILESPTNYYYFRFHEINLTQSWEAAVAWLASLVA